MIIIAFGANIDSTLGAPETTYDALPSLFDPYGITVIRKSTLYRTQPVPASDQPDYQNGTLLISTNVDVFQLMSILLEIEGRCGRIRTEQNAARGIDLDIISYNNLVLEDKSVHIPHPRMQDRGFVLYPLQEIAPEWIHPVLKCSVSDLISYLPVGQRLR